MSSEAALTSSYPFGSLGISRPAEELTGQPVRMKPCFLQIRLGDLKAGILAKPEDVRIQLSCDGLRSFSLPAGHPCLMEPKGFVSFKGDKVLLPLPHHFSIGLGGAGPLPTVRLAVRLASSKDPPQPMSFNDVLKLSGRAVQKHTPEVSVLHANLLLDNLDFDDSNHLRPLGLCEVGEAPLESVLSQLKDTALPAHVPSLEVAACLRDDLAGIDAEQGGRCYIGDAGNLFVEEVLSYPRSPTEFRCSLAAGSSALSFLSLSGFTHLAACLAACFAACLRCQAGTSNGAGLKVHPFAGQYLSRGSRVMPVET